MTYSVQDIADLTGYSIQGVYKRFNIVDKQKLNSLTTVENGKKRYTEGIIELLGIQKKEPVDKQFNNEFNNVDKQFNPMELALTKTIEVLRVQLEAKDKQIQDLSDRNKELIAIIEKKENTEQGRLLLEGNRKPFLSFFSRKK